MEPVIRLATVEDAEQLAGIYTPFVLNTAITFETVPPTVEEWQIRISTIQRALPLVVYELQGRIAGYSYASLHSSRAAYGWCVDASIYIDPSHHRMGLGRALYTSLFSILRAQGYHNVFAAVALPNPGSIGLHQNMGFRQVGTEESAGFKLGRWIPVTWMQLQLQECRQAPTIPRTIQSLTSDVSWPTILGAGQHLLVD